MAAFWDRFPAYVPVAERKRRAAREVAQILKKEGRAAAPVATKKRAIATTFWGKAWCENLEHYSDYASRLPRGRTYLRNGSVLDLAIDAGRVRALVAGSELYKVKIGLARLPAPRWKEIVAECAGQVSSVLALLEGKVSDEVLQVIAEPETGLFPAPAEIDLDCSCPDGAIMCKHVAATLYGVGVRLDEEPGLFFTLRQVDQQELVTAPTRRGSGRRLTGDLGAIFGIALEKPRRAKPRGG